MREPSTSRKSSRRTVLKALGAFGVAAAARPTAAQAADADASYREALQAELTASSRQQKQLPEGSYVYGSTEAEATDAFSLVGGGSATAFDVDSDSVPHTRAERLDVPETDDSTAVAYRGPVTEHSIEPGDRLLGVAWIRSDDGAEASARFGYLDADGQPVGENFVQRGDNVDASEEWLRYFFPVEVGDAPAAGDTLALELQVGSAEQTIEVGGVALLDYADTGVGLGTLPPYHYDGRSPDADWREDAQARIEEHRTTDIEVEVRNPGGQPMNGASVNVEMVEHQFDFGSAVSVEHVTGDSEDDRIYRETFSENFNKAVVENGLKFPAWEGEWDMDREDIRATLDWLNERDVPTRGHYLLWEEYQTDGGGGMNIQDAEEKSAEEIQAEITEKIAEHAAEFEGEVTEWDVHNHPVWQSNFRDDPDLGWEAVDEWWQAADDVTDTELYTNEMGAIGGQWQRDQYLDYIEHLVENDYPIDGIGFMGHHQQQYNQILDIADMEAGFDQFAEFGLPLLITEFDIEIFDRRNAQDVAVQTDYTRDFLTMAFSKEAVEGVLSWGFWEDDHWRPTGAYFDSDWTLRENGEQYFDLVFGEWWTEESGETDGDGTYATGGFKGEYRITAEKGALSETVEATVDDETETVVVELSPPGNGGGKGRGNGNRRGGSPQGNVR
ncbi:endo-1,4-beta-xylanase [Halorubrum sp. AJ67]|uniref:endo-1,4-beta-xylanase n=1 Tax=Halorubrum sp. AJ67 TaxID=1173487 RepID=UPI0003DCED5F|nr:endo-1,4-beta-xylanase [Halorubrum sp. AJ67]CDK38583.1 putative signal peptide protein [Halorubrum sp. AJ67]